MQLDILIDMKLLLCSVTSPRIALAILAKQALTLLFISLFLYCDRNGSGGCEFVPAAAVFACGYKWSAKEIYGMAVAVVFFADRVSNPDFQYV